MKAIIFGVTGQDGYYLAKLLLAKGYQVVGVHRRSSVDNTTRLHSLLSGTKSLQLVEGDITDAHSVNAIVKDHLPDEIYNLAAQSHVLSSFSQPAYTFDVNCKGVLNLLEAVRLFVPGAKLYQASTSEMFGNNFTEMKSTDNSINFRYQNEKTPFMPASPYAAAKCAAHDLIRNYRESYGLHASAGILFNHECFKYDYPFVVRINNQIQILPIQDIAETFGFDNKILLDNKQGTSTKSLPIEVWDRNGWTKIKTVSWFQNKDKKLKIINARNAVYSVSEDHICFDENKQEKKAEDFICGDKVENCIYPEGNNWNDIITLEEAELLGMMVGDGTMSSSEQFTNGDIKIRDRFNLLWEKVTGGRTKYYASTSGFTGEVIGRLDLYGGQDWYKKFDIYTNCKDVFGHRYKKIPWQVLNSNKDVMEAFLIGYNVCDGLKANPCTYLFKNFKTNSPTLAAGLLFLISQVTQQKFNITVEESYKWNKRQLYYSINLLSDRKDSLSKYDIVSKLLSDDLSIREIFRQTGISRKFIQKIKTGYVPQNIHHLELPSNEVKKIITIDDYSGWFFDLETETGTLHAGLGLGIVHNSPMRGEKFVTRKISKWVAEYYYYTKFLGRTNFPKLKLGNIDSVRDWGHAEDYVVAMWLMLQQDIPDDYVVATGETHSVRDFFILAMKGIGIDVTNINDYVDIDKEFMRPTDVTYLCGSSDKARSVLKWSPRHTFESLVKDMVDYDIKLLKEYKHSSFVEDVIDPHEVTEFKDMEHKVSRVCLN